MNYKYKWTNSECLDLIKINQLRKEKQITVNDIAAYVGVWPNTASRWVIGKSRPSFKHMKLIADCLSTTVENLITTKDHNHPYRPTPNINIFIYGGYLRSIREQHALTLGELGELLGYAETTVGNWERESSLITHKTAKEIIDLFGISWNSLVREPKEPDK